MPTKKDIWFCSLTVLGITLSINQTDIGSRIILLLSSLLFIMYGVDSFRQVNKEKKEAQEIRKIEEERKKEVHDALQILP